VYIPNRVAAALINKNEKYENQSMLYKAVDAPLSKYREMRNKVLRHIN
jgi:hypothetical protein